MIKIVKDEVERGFVWHVIERALVKRVWDEGTFVLYALHGDDTESLINTREELEIYLSKGFDIGIEVGFIPEDYEEKYNHQAALDKASEEASELFIQKEKDPFVFYRSKEDKTIFVWLDEELNVVGLNWHHGCGADYHHFGEINDDVTRIFNKITSQNDYDFNVVPAILQAIERYEIAFNLTSYRK